MKLLLRHVLIAVFVALGFCGAMLLHSLSAQHPSILPDCRGIRCIHL